MKPARRRAAADRDSRRTPGRSPAPQGESERRELRRRTIVEAASKLFARRGYADCDMERLAGELKIAKGTIYLYFPGKQELFFACVDWGMQRMQSAVRAAAEAVDDPFERIADAIRAYLEFFAEHPQYAELLIQERAIFKDRKRPTYFEYRDAARVQWRKFYRRLIADGHLRPELRVEAILDTIGNLLYGTMFTNHFLGRAPSIDRQCRGLIDIVLKGIASDDQRAGMKTSKRPSSQKKRRTMR